MKTAEEIRERLNELIKTQSNTYKHQDILGLNETNRRIKEINLIRNTLEWVLGEE